MMDKEQRTKLLEKLSHSSEGKALADYFQELVDGLIDGRTYTSDNFELEGKVSLRAAKVLTKIMTRLRLLEKPKKTNTNKVYI